MKKFGCHGNQKVKSLDYFTKKSYALELCCLVCSIISLPPIIFVEIIPCGHMGLQLVYHPLIKNIICNIRPCHMLLFQIQLFLQSPFFVSCFFPCTGYILYSSSFKAVFPTVQGERFSAFIALLFE